MQKNVKKSGLRIDLKESGLPMLFKPYQYTLLLHIWENVDEDNAIGSGKAHEFILTTDDKKSRASVIFFLNDMVDEGVLGWHDRTGKGGHHRIYYPIMTQAQFWKHVARQAYAKIIEASGDTSIFEG